MLLYVVVVLEVSVSVFVLSLSDAANLEYSLRYMSDAGSVMRVIPDFLKS